MKKMNNTLLFSVKEQGLETKKLESFWQKKKKNKFKKFKKMFQKVV